uniref:Uncharacterized protein n=1 Tax=Hemiselmis andersenii TaxID=464988 RepID=A0A7S1E474_HEMAN|mmetsp:Transcript_34890/g.84899  ORF Transcript_34890/g.84899 Transcript_34890/m.84899 type:complete len:409 (+) Transcript_34890:196-1422(+)
MEVHACAQGGEPVSVSMNTNTQIREHMRASGEANQAFVSMNHPYLADSIPGTPMEAPEFSTDGNEQGDPHPSASFAIPISDEIAPPPTFSLRSELFHMFLSYRVRSDADVVARLYELVVSGSLNDKRIPPGGHGRWPGFAEEPPKGFGKAAKVFWDKKCLQDGKDWEAGFVRGLTCSMVFVPLFSRGAIEGLLSLGGAQDRVDNVLLEWLLALEWLKSPTSGLKSIYPIFFDKKQDGLEEPFADFPWEMLASLPQLPSAKTNRRAAEILRKLGGTEEQIMRMQALSVRQVVDQMLKNQGIKLALVGPEPLSTAASRMLNIVIRDVSSVQCSPDIYAFTRSGGCEVISFLKTRGLISLAPALAHHGITSLRELSLLRGSERETERRRVVQAAVESFARPGGGERGGSTL